MSNDIYVEGDAIFGMIYTTDNFKNIRYIEEILGQNLEDHYTVLISDESKINEVEKEVKSLDITGDPFFYVRDYENNKTELSYFFLLLMVKYQKHVLKDKPLIYIVEDCQQLDSLSVEFIKQILIQINKNTIENIFLLCESRDKKIFKEIGARDGPRFHYAQFIYNIKIDFETNDLIETKEENITKYCGENKELFSIYNYINNGIITLTDKSEITIYKDCDD